MITQISTNVKPVSLFSPCPPASLRAPWEGLSQDLKDRLVEEGEKYLHFQYPTILATDFMEFCRTGNRVNYEDKLFKRRIVLDTLVLAECIEYKGRFLDDIINGIWSICEEKAWQLPSHNAYLRDEARHPLPDITRPVLDLFAAETGSILAMAEYVLRDALQAVSPAISVAVNSNLETRVFKPFLNQHFWWMGDGASHVNNWTSWCTQNVLLAAFTRERLEPWHEDIFKKACKSLDYFLDEYGEDGCCDEGAQYYRHAGLTLFNSLEILNGITDHAFSSVYQETKIYNIAAYILNAHIAGPYYANFADCSPVAGRCNAREYLFGKRTGNPNLMALSAQDYRTGEDSLTLGEHNLFYRIQTVFNHQEMMEYGDDSPIFHPDCFYASAGLFIARDDRFCLAVKAGDNGDSHNHNDTGSFTVYQDGRPMFIDVGVESYTAKTFSPQRYEIWAMQSAYHNLPTFGNTMQKDGECYGSRDVSCSFTEKAASITMDIAPAYPECPELASYIRSVHLEKGKGIWISDTWKSKLSSCALASRNEPVILSLMTYEKPVLMEDAISSDHCCTLAVGTLGFCRIAGISHVETEEIPITDARLGIAWKHSIYRTRVTLAKETITLTLPE